MQTSQEKDGKDTTSSPADCMPSLRQCIIPSAVPHQCQTTSMLLESLLHAPDPHGASFLCTPDRVLHKRGSSCPPGNHYRSTTA